MPSGIGSGGKCETSGRFVGSRLREEWRGPLSGPAVPSDEPPGVDTSPEKLMAEKQNAGPVKAADRISWYPN